jgi:hypothetical protein
MALIGSDFVQVYQEKTVHCSECGGRIQEGTIALESVRGGQVMKRICGERCRESFDDRYWQRRADMRERMARARVLRRACRG